MATDLDRAALDVLGTELMSNVRDRAIQEWDDHLEGQIPYPTIQQMLAELDETARARLADCLPWIVDSTLFYVLAWLDTTRCVTVRVSTSAGTVESIRDASDGITAELKGENGWVERSSKMRPGETAPEV